MGEIITILLVPTFSVFIVFIPLDVFLFHLIAKP